MNEGEKAKDRVGARAGGLWWLVGLGAVLAAIEAAILLGPFVSETGGAWRSTALEWGAFWPGLLYDWEPNFPAQPAVMFLTYGFLHGGPVHLIVNLVTLVSLGRGVTNRAGAGKFLALYLMSMLGGAIAFGVLATGPQPMVGASGALFGLAGAILAWDYLDRFTEALSLWPVARAVLFLLALNLVLWWAMEGLLAWQTHLGGFVAGWIAAMLLDPVPRRT